MNVSDTFSSSFSVTSMSNLTNELTTNFTNYLPGIPEKYIIYIKCVVEWKNKVCWKLFD